ncbi:MAG: hypothetical protein AAGJ85_04580, partial [Pseudomonadota bacterium]
MALTVQTTDIVGSGAAFTFAAVGDSFILAEGVTLVSTGGSPTVISGNEQNSVSIYGSVFGGDLGIEMNETDAYVFIGQSGVVSGENFAVAIDNLGFSNFGSVINYGTLSGEAGIGHFTAGVIYNYGSVVGGAFA